MINLNKGDRVESPGGRQLLVDEVFVPRYNQEKGHSLPARFRQCSRKVVVFHNGSIAPLQDIKAHYKIIQHHACAA
ncbi:MAG: hypothetical protein K6L76_02395 [Agarilytica sp.]